MSVAYVGCYRPILVEIDVENFATNNVALRSAKVRFF